MYLPSPSVLKVLGYKVSKEILYQDRRPEENLYCYVLINSIEDVMLTHSDRKSSLQKCEAHNWLISNTEDFKKVCEWALLDPELVLYSYKLSLKNKVIKFTARQVGWKRYYNFYLRVKTFNIKEKRKHKGHLKKLRNSVFNSSTTFISTIFLSVI